jgi:hypothetical protein
MLAMEMVEFIRFKTATLTAFGLQRNGVWGEETASQKIEHLGLMFGALAAHPKGTVRGYGVPLQHLTFGLLVFPSIWDWYVQWRERRRGFYTAWEVDMLRISLAMTRKETGWLRQHPQLASRVRPIDGLVSQRDTLRDNAQEGRDRLFKILSELPGEGAYAAVKALAEEHPHPAYRRWMAVRARERAIIDADEPAWPSERVHAFAMSLESAGRDSL